MTEDRGLYQLHTDTEGLSAAARERFLKAISFAHYAIDVLAQDVNCPPLAVQTIATANFAATVQRAYAESPFAFVRESQFSGTRIGGNVAGKNVDLSSDGSLVRVIFDGAIFEGEDTHSMAWGIFLVAHELTHPLIGRLRHASGALNGVEFPSLTPRQGARSMCRSAIEEYRADRIANIFLGRLVNTSDGQPLQLGTLTDLGYSSQVIEAVHEVVWPHLPRLVQSYREYQISLDEMLGRITSTTDQLITLLGHMQAEVESVGEPNPLESECQSHPGVTHLLGPLWHPIETALTEQSLLPRMTEFRDAEANILDIGEQAVMQFWELLGLTFSDGVPGSDAYVVNVEAPANAASWG